MCVIAIYLNKLNKVVTSGRCAGRRRGAEARSGGAGSGRRGRRVRAVVGRIVLHRYRSWVVFVSDGRPNCLTQVRGPFRLGWSAKLSTEGPGRTDGLSYGRTDGLKLGTNVLQNIITAVLRRLHVSPPQRPERTTLTYRPAARDGNTHTRLHKSTLAISFSPTHQPAHASCCGFACGGASHVSCCGFACGCMHAALAGKCRRRKPA